MYSLNRATVIGNITRDPELRYTPNGQAVTSFSVATNRRWKNQATNEFQEATEYHDAVAWGKAAEFLANYMKKGNKIYIDGRLQTRGWETPDGVKQRRTEIVVENFVPLTPKGTVSEGFDSISDLADTGAQDAPADTADQSTAKPATAAKKSTKAAATDVAGTSAASADVRKASEASADEINLEDIPF